MKDKLLHLLDHNGFISGPQLAQQLNVSRTAIWKQINTLKKIGYEIESVKNKGYRLRSRPDIPIAAEVTLGLNTKVIGSEIYYSKKIPSTNLFAKQLTKETVKEGTVVVADMQTTGRGRKDRTWFSPEGGLYFSVILFPDIPPQQGMLVTMAASIAVAQGIKKVTNLDSEIKWPNDLLIDGRKVCGILTEFDGEIDRINYTVVGIGINVNNPLNETLQETAIALIEKLRGPVSRVMLLRSILQCLDENYEMLKAGDYEAIRTMWLSKANIVGRMVQIQGEKELIRGVVSGVDRDGSLIVKTQQRDLRVICGDVNYL
jgi:BirA family biotin operon repressor/biotin-[acetyl-CoA-carboxylase] ligase